MRFQYVLLALAILVTTPAIAQDEDKDIDSLRSVVESASTDSLKVNALIELSTRYLETNAQRAIETGNQARSLAEEIGFSKGLGFAYKAVARGYVILANYPEALEQYRKSLEVFESIEYKKGIANILSNIGVVYSNTGEDTKSIEYHLKSLKVSEEIGDKMRIATSLNNIGGVYTNNPATIDNALQYYQRALPIFREIDYSYGVGTITANIGEIFVNRKQYDSALHYLDISLKAYAGSIDATFPLTLSAQIFAERNDFDRALKAHLEAIQIAEQLEAKLELTQALLGLAATQARQGDARDAISTYSRAEAIGASVRARKEMRTAYEELSKLYAAQGKFKDAYRYEALFSAIKDSILNADEVNKRQRMQYNFDMDKKEAEIKVQDVTIQRQKTINYAAAVTGFLLLLLIIGMYNRYQYTKRTNKIIKDERDRSKSLLLNILPEETARELEEKGNAQTRFYDNVTVLFTDFKGFSTIAGKLSPQDLVAELNDYFVAFDEIVDKHNLEKIKTIGDAYMCAGGIPTANSTHPHDAVRAGLEMQAFMIARNAYRQRKGLEGWELRVGIHSGPVVAGVVGKRKYAYDIWGDTVNVASRMESNGEPGKVNISASTFAYVKDEFPCVHRGKIHAKNIGEVDMYFVDVPVAEPVSS
jgi:class 3 adenylate cyclase